MKAIQCTIYGPPDVLQLEEVEKPAPNDGEILVKVHAASVNPADYHTMRGGVARFVGWLLRIPPNPRLGTHVAGRVEVVGKDVTQFQPGNEVFGGGRPGFAEYACARENSLALKPANLSFEEAAAVPTAAITALQGLRDKGQIQVSQKVLICGASGGVRTFAVQIAKAFGAEVTAVCSTRNLDIARSIGADYVIDYTKEDFTRNGQRYDLIFAGNGYRSILDYRRALCPRGIYVGAGGSMAQIFQHMLLGPLISKTGSKKFCSFMAKVDNNDLRFLKEFLEAGKVKPVIDRCYPLSDVPEALRYIGQGHAKGK